MPSSFTLHLLSFIELKKRTLHISEENMIIICLKIYFFFLFSLTKFDIWTQNEYPWTIKSLIIFAGTSAKISNRIWQPIAKCFYLCKDK